MKKNISSSAKNGHFRLGRKWDREGKDVELTKEDLDILDADPRIKVRDCAKTK